MRALIGCLTMLILWVAVPGAQSPAGKSLQIYVVDVEGGNATLFVAPSGQSVLIDTGNAGARDTDRIMAALKDAGLTQIDHLITTHWHGDHFGAMEEIAGRIPIRHFIDHGPTVETQARPVAFLKDTYPTLYAKSKRTVVQPGDTVPITGLDWRIVTSAGKALTSALAGAGAANPACARFTRQADDASDNAQSVGSVVTFGRFRVAHLGDLTWNKEFDLMCPSNRIGTVDLHIVSHHGLDVSNSEVLVHAIQARAAIMNNGVRKGGQPSTMKTLYAAPRLLDVWQMHFSQLSGQEYTVPGVFIANSVDDQPSAMPIEPMAPPPAGSSAPPPPVHSGQAYWFKVSAQADGSFTVTNTRNGFAKTYAVK